MKITLLFCLLTSFQFSFAQNIIHFTDQKLKAKLIKADTINKIAKNIAGQRVKVDVNGDGEISSQEALQIYSLDFYPGEISNLDGIESFENLKVLNLSSNDLLKFEHIDLPNLEKLDLLDNHISILNIDNLQNLKDFRIQQNKLKVLAIHGLKKLESINYSFGELKDLNLENLPSLNYLHIANNKLSGHKNFNHLKNLKTLYLSDNNLKSIKIDGLTMLRDLRIENNKISKIRKKMIDQLDIFECYNNKFKCPEQNQ